MRFDSGVLTGDLCVWCNQGIEDEEVRYKIVDEVFQQIDIDDNGVIVL